MACTLSSTSPKNPLEYHGKRRSSLLAFFTRANSSSNSDSEKLSPSDELIVKLLCARGERRREGIDLTFKSVEM